MKRRSVLQCLGYGGGLVGAAVLPFALTRLVAPPVAFEAHRHLRPPGAFEDDEAFVSACIGCGLCGEICPPRCIKFHRREGGGAQGTPYIDPEQRGCTLCGKCMATCPTAALKPVPPEDVTMGIAQIDRAACYPWVDRGICGACVSVCPLGERAIGFEMWGQYRPVITRDCVGCGLCVEVCPHPSLPIRVVARAQATITSHAV